MVGRHNDIPSGERAAGAPRLLLSTRNEHKRREFARLLSGFEVDALPDEVVLPPEDGDTFEAERARQGASRCRRHRQSQHCR